MPIYPPTKGRTPRQIAEDRRMVDERNAEIKREREQRQKEEEQRAKKMKKMILVVGGIVMALVVCLAAVGVFMCIRPPSFEDRYAKVCDLPGEGTIWKAVNTGPDGELIWQSSFANGEPTEDDEDVKNEVLKPSKWFEGYYFYPNGRRFYVAKDGERGFTVYLEEKKLQTLASVGQVAFLAKPMKCEGLHEGHQIFQIEETLFWASLSKKTLWKKEELEKLAKINTPESIEALPRNRSAVLLNGEFQNGASEFFGLQFADHKPVYVGRIITEYKTGTTEVEKSLYYFVWGDVRMNIDCKALKGSPIKPGADDVFKEVVKPFKVNICAREMEIGLDSTTKQYAEKGTMVKKRTLYFNVDGERYLAEEN
jgi:hypothetical protein